MYDVVWNSSGLPDNVTIAANTAASTIRNAVAVGTTPMDALIAYVQAHNLEDSLEQDLWAMAPLLRAQDEGVQALRAATDEIQNWNYARTSGGVHWCFQNKPGTSTAAQTPSAGDVQNLEDLNQAQHLLYGISSQLERLQWDLFAQWWKYVWLTVKDRSQTKVHFKDQITLLMTKIEALTDLANDQQSEISKKTAKTSTIFDQPPQRSTLPEFTQSRDPTLLIGGVEAGWPDDYMDDNLLVRLDSQTRGTTTLLLDESLYCLSVLPTILQPTGLALVREFVAFGPTNISFGSSTGSSTEADPDPSYSPLYHDHGKHGDSSGPLRDQWGQTQPWFPLFVEWEVEYYHIPWAAWQMDGIVTDKSVDANWQLGISPEVHLSDPKYSKDVRILSGRILLLPQPNFSLQAAIADLFNTTPSAIMNKYLPNPDDQNKVKNEAYKLPLMSGPMDGFTAGLLIVSKGTHIKPNTRIPGHGLQALEQAALDPFTTDVLSAMKQSSDVTPFGSLVRFTIPDSSDPSTTQLSSTKPTIPFKPVTHGQFRFSKINVIDKFGQAVCAIDPAYGHEHDQAIYPCLSTYLAPQALESGQCNTVLAPEAPVACEFTQVPPSINQPSRLNCAFLTHDERWTSDASCQFSYWRPTTEWESPVWGWVVLNYADYGVQLFLPDGTFYREVRVAQPNGAPETVVTPKWLPMRAPPIPPKVGQLDKLIVQLTTDPGYLQSFVAMANQSLDNATSTPSSYNTILSSLLGRLSLSSTQAGASSSPTHHAQINPTSTEAAPSPSTRVSSLPRIRKAAMKCTHSLSRSATKTAPTTASSATLTSPLPPPNPSPPGTSSNFRPSTPTFLALLRPLRPLPSKRSAAHRTATPASAPSFTTQSFTHRTPLPPPRKTVLPPPPLSTPATLTRITPPSA
jgi:hypothetical protein